jgi:hypothetical protein
LERIVVSCNKKNESLEAFEFVLKAIYFQNSLPLLAGGG